MKQRKAILSVRIPSSAYSTSEAEARARRRMQSRTATGPTIIVDTREGRPWTFDRSKKGTLQTGDYSVAGLEKVIAVERKSHADIYATLSTVRRRKRFEAELERSRELKFFALVIEVTLSDFRQPPPKPAAKVRPYDRDATWHHLERLCVKFNLAPWFCDGRVQAQAVAERLLTAAYLRFWREIC